MATAGRLALLSVTDKTGIEEFGRGLVAAGFELLSTGGTAKALRAAGLAVTEVGDFTGFPEMLGGRVKTLQAKLLAGVLARTELASDAADLAAHAIPPIDVVAVNLYRFADAAARYQAAGGGVAPLEAEALAHVIEEIDIGGPTVIRAACKNCARVTTVVDPADYPRVVAAVAGGARPPSALRAELTAKAFRIIAQYDRDISAFFDTFVAPHSAPKQALPIDAAALLQGDLPATLAPLLAASDGEPVIGADARRLRYGENPHQKGFVLRGRAPGEASVLHGRVLTEQKELSYNNFLDADSALELVKEFAEPAAVIVKHNNPCGCAIGATPSEAFERCYAGDPLSAFGGILALNRPLDAELARKIAVPERFLEVLIAPSVTPDALAALRAGAPWGKNLRVVACGEMGGSGAGAGGVAATPRFTVRSIVGGALVQERDLGRPAELKWPTKRAATPAEQRDLDVAWRIVKHVRSNAIVLVKDGQLVGAGAGQMSRVDSVEIAVKKAGERAKGAALGSDAFFPFRDGLDAAAAAGVTAVIQPGGSRRDDEVIRACDEQGVAMAFTGMRHFRH
ncbi:MAG: bifunctional phosphoribosylaminoimidazolecarboxamide formyltransferase/IMP cyclohydrolase [Planctomycetes bacterium]|nr:bifunctional phosphoribosylaminoimidazolecarboxamide formyltransferase/IMP cyclohydrolase [Planctomycetota bacterium]